MSLEMQLTTFSDQLTAAVDNIVKHRFDMWVDENRARQEKLQVEIKHADMTAITSSITTQLTTIMDDLLVRALVKQHIVTPEELGAYATSASAMGRKFFPRTFHTHSPRLWTVGLNDATCKDKKQLVEHVTDAVILEIGAADAQDIITLAGIAKRVYAYEPNSDKSNYIHVAVNAAGMSNAVLVRPVAASNETGSLIIDPFDVTSNTSSPTGIAAQSVRISDEIKERVHFASISATGQELQVLDGMKELVMTYDVDIIHIALHRSSVFPDSHNQWADVAVWFQEAGYLCHVCNDAGGDPITSGHASITGEELRQMAQFVQKMDLMCF
jgi:FkbM family methyltransferase